MWLQQTTTSARWSRRCAPCRDQRSLHTCLSSTSSAVCRVQVAELKALVAAQHERCAVLGAEAQSMERQLAAAQDELRTANTAMVSQAKALEMASQQQSYLQRKLDDALQVRGLHHAAGVCPCKMC